MLGGKPNDNNPKRRKEKHGKNDRQANVVYLMGNNYSNRQVSEPGRGKRNEQRDTQAFDWISVRKSGRKRKGRINQPKGGKPKPLKQ